MKVLPRKILNLIDNLFYKILSRTNMRHPHYFSFNNSKYNAKITNKIQFSKRIQHFQKWLSHLKKTKLNVNSLIYF
jgi:hypothetical protein